MLEFAKIPGLTKIFNRDDWQKVFMACASLPDYRDAKYSSYFITTDATVRAGKLYYKKNALDKGGYSYDPISHVALTNEAAAGVPMSKNYGFGPGDKYEFKSFILGTKYIDGSRNITEDSQFDGSKLYYYKSGSTYVRYCIYDDVVTSGSNRYFHRVCWNSWTSWSSADQLTWNGTKLTDLATVYGRKADGTFVSIAKSLISKESDFNAQYEKYTNGFWIKDDQVNVDDDRYVLTSAHPFVAEKNVTVYDYVLIGDQTTKTDRSYYYRKCVGVTETTDTVFADGKTYFSVEDGSFTSTELEAVDASEPASPEDYTYHVGDPITDEYREYGYVCDEETMNRVYEFVSIPSTKEVSAGGLPPGTTLTVAILNKYGNRLYYMDNSIDLYTIASGSGVLTRVTYLATGAALRDSAFAETSDFKFRKNQTYYIRKPSTGDTESSYEILSPTLYTIGRNISDWESEYGKLVYSLSTVFYIADTGLVGSLTHDKNYYERAGTNFPYEGFVAVTTAASEGAAKGTLFQCKRKTYEVTEDGVHGYTGNGVSQTSKAYYEYHSDENKYIKVPSSTKNMYRTPDGSTFAQLTEDEVFFADKEYYSDISLADTSKLSIGTEAEVAHGAADYYEGMRIDAYKGNVYDRERTMYWRQVDARGNGTWEFNVISSDSRFGVTSDTEYNPAKEYYFYTGTGYNWSRIAPENMFTVTPDKYFGYYRSSDTVYQEGKEYYIDPGTNRLELNTEMVLIDDSTGEEVGEDYIVFGEFRENQTYYKLDLTAEPHKITIEDLMNGNVPGNYSNAIYSVKKLSEYGPDEQLIVAFGSGDDLNNKRYWYVTGGSEHTDIFITCPAKYYPYDNMPYSSYVNKCRKAVTGALAAYVNEDDPQPNKIRVVNHRFYNGRGGATAGGGWADSVQYYGQPDGLAGYYCYPLIEIPKTYRNGDAMPVIDYPGGGVNTGRPLLPEDKMTVSEVIEIASKLIYLKTNRIANRMELPSGVTAVWNPTGGADGRGTYALNGVTQFGYLCMNTVLAEGTVGTNTYGITEPPGLINPPGSLIKLDNSNITLETQLSYYPVEPGTGVVYVEGIAYYRKDGEYYYRMHEGEDYNVGDPIPADTAYRELVGSVESFKCATTYNPPRTTHVKNKAWSPGEIITHVVYEKYVLTPTYYYFDKTGASWIQKFPEFVLNDTSSGTDYLGYLIGGQQKTIYEKNTRGGIPTEIEIGVRFALYGDEYDGINLPNNPALYVTSKNGEPILPDEYYEECYGLYYWSQFFLDRGISTNGITNLSTYFTGSADSGMSLMIRWKDPTIMIKKNEPTSTPDAWNRTTVELIYDGLDGHIDEKIYVSTSCSAFENDPLVLTINSDFTCISPEGYRRHIPSISNPGNPASDADLVKYLRYGYLKLTAISQTGMEAVSTVRISEMVYSDEYRTSAPYINCMIVDLKTGSFLNDTVFVNSPLSGKAIPGVKYYSKEENAERTDICETITSVNVDVDVSLRYQSELSYVKVTTPAAGVVGGKTVVEPITVGTSVTANSEIEFPTAEDTHICIVLDKRFADFSEGGLRKHLSISELIRNGWSNDIIPLGSAIELPALLSTSTTATSTAVVIDVDNVRVCRDVEPSYVISEDVGTGAIRDKVYYYRAATTDILTIDVTLNKNYIYKPIVLPAGTNLGSKYYDQDTSKPHYQYYTKSLDSGVARFTAIDYSDSSWPDIVHDSQKQIYYKKGTAYMEVDKDAHNVTFRIKTPVNTVKYDNTNAAWTRESGSISSNIRSVLNTHTYNLATTVDGSSNPLEVDTSITYYVNRSDEYMAAPLNEHYFDYVGGTWYFKVSENYYTYSGPMGGTDDKDAFRQCISEVINNVILRTYEVNDDLEPVIVAASELCVHDTFWLPSAQQLGYSSLPYTFTYTDPETSEEKTATVCVTTPTEGGVFAYNKGISIRGSTSSVGKGASVVGTDRQMSFTRTALDQANPTNLVGVNPESDVASIIQCNATSGTYSAYVYFTIA